MSSPASGFGPESSATHSATPPVRLGFLIVLLLLILATALVYGVPYVAFRAGYAYEAGRSKASYEALAKLDEAGVINKASALFRAAAMAVAPAVVNIQCFKEVSRFHHDGAPLAGMPPSGSILPSSFGSGVIIDKARGYVVTNGHVVDGADEIQVRIGRGREYTARLVGADAKTDLAVLQVNATLETEAVWADIQSLDIGDWVLAIGSPFRLERSVTAGIVSAIGRRNLRIFGEPGDYEDFIQSDAAINPGNSGGPLIDLRGRVVGINTAIFSPSTGPETEGQSGNVGIGFAISAALARNVADQIIRNGRVVRGYIGVSLDEITSSTARILGLGEQRGALVLDVVPNSPAARAGLLRDDVILEINGQPVFDVADLRNRTSALAVGSTAQLKLFRQGKDLDQAVTIESMPFLRTLGLEIKAEESPDPNVPPLFLVEQVDPTSPAALAGFRPGQRLIAIGNRVLKTYDEIETIATRYKLADGILFQIQQPDGKIETLTLGGRRRP